MGFQFGVDYYPEHWGRERLEKDAELMEEMGIGAVRMAEFAWSRIEPEPGVFCFEWLDEAVSVMYRHGISTILGTPTAAPPAWLTEKYPDILPVDSHGMVKGFGGRHHDCQSSQDYRNAVGELVTAMARHYRDHPAIAGWQIDNELGNSHEDLCMCPSCQRAFQEWLKRRYKTIQELNKSWGTVFWSQEYQKFEQIPAPRDVPTAHNPSLLLNWRRFCSDLVIDFLKYQADIIRTICPGHMVTHNLMGFYDKTDYFKMAEQLDVAANDQYPTGYYFEQPGQSPDEVAACYDFIRSVKKKPFWMMEMQSGATGGSIIGRTPKPSQLKLWTYQTAAHGADAVVFFRWRTCLFGTEQFWHGILPHDGVPGRTFRELAGVIQELTPVMKDMEGICQRAETAIVFSYDQDWAFKIQPHHPELTYTGQVQMIYKSLYSQNIPVDFIREGDKMDEYKLVFAPLSILMDEESAGRYGDYVRNGGHLVMTMRSGAKDRENVCSQSTLPGYLADLLGINIHEYDCLLMDEAVLTDPDGNAAGYGRKWCDIISPVNAQPLLYYGNQYYQGMPALTCSQSGKGRAYYAGCEPEQKLLDRLTADWVREAGISCPYSQASASGMDSGNAEVEIVFRPGRKHDYLFVMNHDESVKEYALDPEWRELSGDDAAVEGTVREMDGRTEIHRKLGTFGVNVFFRDKPER